MKKILLLIIFFNACNIICLEQKKEEKRQRDKGIFKCDVCGYVLQHKQSFERHLKKHASNKPLCLTCNKTFPSAKALEKHRNTSQSHLMRIENAEKLAGSNVQDFSFDSPLIMLASLATLNK